MRRETRLTAIVGAVVLTLSGCASNLMDHYEDGYSDGERVRAESKTERMSGTRCDDLAIERYGIDARLSHGDEAPPEADVYWGGCMNAATGSGRVTEDQLYLFTEPPPGG